MFYFESHEVLSFAMFHFGDCHAVLSFSLPFRDLGLCKFSFLKNWLYYIFELFQPKKPIFFWVV